MKNLFQSNFFLLKCTILLFSLLIHNIILAQHPAEISISLSPGYTFVDFESAIDWPENYLSDWDQFHLSLNAKGYIPSRTNLQIGAEAGWNQLYYAAYKIPDVTYSYIYRNYDVSTLSLMLLGRFSINNFFITGSIGIHDYEHGIELASGLEAGLGIKISEKLFIPLSLRLVKIFYGSTFCSSVSVGLTYKFNQK
jgi:hypothetical protein